jgi:hypothetical protein
LGKFAERARMPVPPNALAAHKTQYCPWHTFDTSGKNGYHSHIHAAYTALAFDLIESHAPQLIAGDMAPFVNRAELQASAGAGSAGAPRTPGAFEPYVQFGLLLGTMAVPGAFARVLRASSREVDS